MKKIFVILLLVLMTSCAEDTQMPERTKTEKTIVNEDVIGEASTKIFDKSENRIRNIELACKSINKKILSPNEEFSFNSSTGVRNAENGYKDATVIVDGENCMGIGGGVCQVSTTIYMAARNANLKITEHHLHSKPLEYAPERDDATVDFGKLDLKFVNDTIKEVCIYTWISDGYVYCKIVAS